MICSKCGAEINDGAKFCRFCGSQLVFNQNVAVEPNNSNFVPSNPNEKKPNKAMIIGIVLIAVVLVVIGILITMFVIQKTGQGEHPVTLSVNAQNYSTSNASRIPIEVTGKDSNNQDVNETFYIDENGEGINLKSGDYKLKVAASPLSKDGNFWSSSSKEMEAKIPKELSSNESYDGLKDVAIVFELIDLIKVSDEEISKSYEYMKKDEKYKDKADEYKKATDEAKEKAKATSMLPVGVWGFTSLAGGMGESLEFFEDYTAEGKSFMRRSYADAKITSYAVEIQCEEPYSTVLGNQCVKLLLKSSSDARIIYYVMDDNRLYQTFDDSGNLTDDDLTAYNNGNVFEKTN
ncbi:MAG: zinc ribbon domain-containing protein [Coriobacteriales bacterium]|nr:zinc ribbon domain-containing protein [Coriobacteriales bacterium]